MAVRPKTQPNVLPFPFTASNTVTKGFAVVHGASDYTCQNAGAGAAGFGIAANDAVTGGDVSVWGPGSIVEVVVGTGGATRGSWAVCVADGLANQTLASGTTLRNLVGIFMETATAGQRAALYVTPNTTFTA